MDLTIRTVREDEFEAASAALEAAFSGGLSDEGLARERLVTEFDRWHAAFEGDRIVGGAAVASYRMTVPGGAAVPTAGVTSVGVLPTHRRRGINTALMRAQLDDVRSRGEPLAALFASEGGIYGRYGYGVAAFSGDLDLEVARSDFIRGYRPSGRVRLLSRTEALPLMRSVYDAERRRRPGMVELDDRWWGWLFTESSKDEETPVRYVVHDVGGEPDAFATYVVKHEWPDSIAKLRLTVRRLVASTPQGAADIWRYLFDIDLVGSVQASNRPEDDPLLLMMREPRRLRFTLQDGLYVRLVDLPVALTARAYAAAQTLVLEVADPFCPWNEGRWELRTGGDGPRCERTEAPADIACTATDLGAVYLGGFGFARLHRAGRIHELTEGALARADAAFRSDPGPWCAFVF
jgi:predicted acetyltransferase